MNELIKMDNVACKVDYVKVDNLKQKKRKKNLIIFK